MFATLLGIFGEASTLHYALETFLIAAVTFLYFRRREVKDPRVKLTEKQKDELIAEWKPEPLVPDTPQDHPVLNPRFVDGKMTKYVKIDGKEYLNMVTSNFLGFVGEQRIEEVAKKTIFKYGVGSCGPRGFYGTVDVHLDLEKELAQFFGCEEAVLYSYGFATIASAIPAYAKRGDVIFVDKGVNFAIQKGLQASRARVEWFEHNDMKDLERLLELQAEKDKKDPAKAAKTRRFMVVEGIYANSGEICPLQKLMEFKWQYKVRIFIDESYSFGVLGKTGRGVTEHFNIPMIDVDMVMASLENAIASTGGFCVGRSYVVGHQRLSGLGYCFSASLPPLLATAASEAIKIIDEQPERVNRVRGNAAKVHQALEKIFSGTSFALVGAEISPLKHVQWKGKKEQAEEVLDQLVNKLFENHSILVTRARYLVKEECFPVEPSVKVMVQSELTEEEMDRFVSAVSDIVQNL